MKFILILLLSVIGFASCKKDAQVKSIPNEITEEGFNLHEQTGWILESNWHVSEGEGCYAIYLVHVDQHGHYSQRFVCSWSKAANNLETYGSREGIREFDRLGFSWEEVNDARKRMAGK